MLVGIMDADRSSSKRSFAQVASSTTLLSLQLSGCNQCTSAIVPVLRDSCDTERVSPFKRRYLSRPWSTMPVQTSPPSLPDSFPSLMSVFGGIAPRFPEEDHSAALKHFQVNPHVTVNTSRRPHPFQHRASVSSSVNSGSADSSPTTTISTFDSSSATDTSPSSSPESPSAMPISFPKFMPPMSNIESQSHPAAQGTMANSLSDAPIPARPDSPGRRAKNLKNLSLRMAPPSHLSRPSIATASIVETTSQHHLSAPPSPVHIPPKSSRRKPANLTIRTPGFDKSFSSNVTETVPPTPHTLHSLRHTESSPSLTSIFSPSFGPKGGMQLPRPMTHHGSRRPSGVSENNLSPLQSAVEEDPPASDVLHELEEEDDHLDSRESTRRNERSYPNGPIQIYDSGVYLYLEPTMQEASQFDVVVNVAKEVTNPFANASTKNETVMSAWRSASVGSKRSSCVEPTTAISEMSFKSALEYPVRETESPATPRGGDSSGPEYLHVGWDHNSEILEDLQPLCELIDSRISEGKKVLIHCQLGASRSASLVIAYGLYKNRDLDFNSMYDIVKGRSRWVGPNMSLIYQLTDFRLRLQHGGPSKPAPQEWFVRGPRRSSEPQPSLSPKAPQADLNPSDCGSCSPGDSVTASPSCLSQTPSNTLSVPSTHQTTPSSTTSWRLPKSLTHKRSLSPRPLPLRQPVDAAQSRGANGAAGVFERDSLGDPAAIFSPRTNHFLTPSLAPPFPQGLQERSSNGLCLRTRIADPRSPPPGTERLIMRNIDEFL